MDNQAKVINFVSFVRNSLICVCALACAGAVSAQVFVAVNANDAAVKQLAAILDTTTTLTAEVEQLLMDQDGRELQENRAELMMQKPASFYWAIKEPYEELMVTDGKLIWRYEPD